MSFYIWGLVAGFFSIKALGGTFGFLLASPWAGALVCLALGGFFLRGAIAHRSEVHAAPPPTPRGRAIFFCAFLVLLAIAVKVRIDRVCAVSIDVRRADMLPNVLSGFPEIMRGESPYHAHVLEDGSFLAHYYPPTLWLGYLPFHLFGADIRYYNILSQALICLGLAFVFLARKTYPYSFAKSGAFFLALTALYLFSKIAMIQIVDVHTATLGIALMGWMIGVHRRLAWLVGITIPILLLARETAVIFVLPYALWLLKNHRRQFWSLTASTSFFVLVGILPFLLSAGSDFFGGARFYSRLIHTMAWQDMVPYYGLGGILKKYGLLWLQPALQLSGLALAAAIIFRRPSTSPLLPIYLGALAYLPFILFVAVTWHYLYLEPFVALLFLLTADEKSSKPFTTT